MEDIAYVFSIMTFALVIYIMTTMATKKDLRRLTERDSGRSGEMRSMLEARIGTTCTLVLTDASILANPAAELTGVIRDVDDEWVLVETRARTGRARGRGGTSDAGAAGEAGVEGDGADDAAGNEGGRLVAMRLERVQGVRGYSIGGQASSRRSRFERDCGSDHIRLASKPSS